MPVDTQFAVEYTTLKQERGMKNKFFINLFVLLTATYVVLGMVLPSDPAVLAKYDISQLQARLLNLTIVIPIVIIWLTALYGFIRFRSYGALVHDSKEGAALNYLSTGLMILAFSLPVTSILSSLLSYLALNHTELLPSTTIVRNYTSLLFSLGAFILISKGARGLTGTIKKRPAHILSNERMVQFIIILSSIFTWLLITKPLRGDSTINYYYLPEWLLIFTIAIPYLYAWYKGIIASYNLRQYTKGVNGTVYKQAFGDLAKGIAVVVFVSVFIQVITTLSAQLNRLNLTPLLLLIYLLVILYAIGFGVVARGAKKLKKIEEVV